MKHFMISACAGYDDSFAVVKEGFSFGHVTKDEYDKTLFAYQKSCEELKSEQREEGAAATANGPIVFLWESLAQPQPETMGTENDMPTKFANLDTSKGSVDNPTVCATCAACGKGGDGLKKCGACELVKYCSKECQRSHRPKHKAECKKRAAEIFDELLFKQPPTEDCPICCLPLPVDDVYEGCHAYYQVCCGQNMCFACILTCAHCPFCRASAYSYQDHFDLLKKRLESHPDDAKALDTLACKYSSGTDAVPEDRDKAFSLVTRAADLGSAHAQIRLAEIYQTGNGVEKDMKKCLHYAELAAIGGNVQARYYLADVEVRKGNNKRAAKHYIIAAKAGGHKIDAVRKGYEFGYITKEEYEETLRANHEARSEMKSDQREKAASTFLGLSGDSSGD